MIVTVLLVHRMTSDKPPCSLPTIAQLSIATSVSPLPESDNSYLLPVGHGLTDIMSPAERKSILVEVVPFGVGFNLIDRHQIRIDQLSQFVECFHLKLPDTFF
jgi:hypothetical protein